MEVVILAGGIGSRLRSVVSEVPKCMAEVNGKPFLHYLFQYLMPFNPERVILSLGYKHEIVEHWIASLILPFEVVNRVESSPLGTGGAIKDALSAVKGKDAIVLNGDTFFEVDLSDFLHFHQKKQGVEVSLALKPMRDFDRYGSVTIDPTTHIISGFEEKKLCEEGLINGGVYAINKQTLASFPEKFSMENDYFTAKVNEKKLSGYVCDGYFIDIGIPDDYEKAQQSLPGR